MPVLTLVATALTLILGGAAWAGIRSDPRRLSNGLLLAAALVAAYVALGSTSPELSPDDGLVILTVLLSPLLVLVLAGFLVVNGVVMWRREGRSLGNLLSLLAGLGILGVVGLGLILIFNASTWTVALALFLVGLCGWLGAQFAAFLLYQWLYQQIVSAQRVDYVVVLGCGLIGGRVPPLLARRIEAGLALMGREVAAGRRPVLVLSGGRGPDEPIAEARAMAAYARERGVPPEAMIIEDASRNTEENLRFTKRLTDADPRLGPNARGVAVTSNFHAFRAGVLARQLGLPMQAVGAPSAGYFWPSAIIREFVGLLAQRPLLNLGLALLICLPLPLAVLLASN